MQRIDFRVTVDLGPGADEQERSDAVAALRRILIAKEVGPVVRPRSDAASDNAKSLDVLNDAALVASVATSAFAILREAIRAWERQRSGRTAKVTLGEHSLELNGITQQQAAKIAEAFWERTTPPEDADDELP
ncbi:hypothetical protein AB0K52_24800 [Glycomyces sp. NPDC049804]|uniref:hypothetical protein n=1 Tax=Glycomyces sp. NPDC049804 TaxID=3154363 RepID=UPI00342C5F86